MVGDAVAVSIFHCHAIPYCTERSCQQSAASIQPAIQLRAVCTGILPSQVAKSKRSTQPSAVGIQPAILFGVVLTGSLPSQDTVMETKNHEPQRTQRKTFSATGFARMNMDFKTHPSENRARVGTLKFRYQERQCTEPQNNDTGAERTKDLTRVIRTKSQPATSVEAVTRLRPEREEPFQTSPWAGG
jgi:hypothetical protein